MTKRGNLLITFSNICVVSRRCTGGKSLSLHETRLLPGSESVFWGMTVHNSKDDRADDRKNMYFMLSHNFGPARSHFTGE